MIHGEKNIPHTLDNRKLILTEYDNSQLVNSFFNIPHNPDEFSLECNIPQYNETEKFCILFSSKGGSTIINSILTDNKIGFLDRNNQFDSSCKDYFNFTKGNTNRNISTEFDEFIKLVNGKSKKDLIIVTRNPIYKFLSGIFQDISLDLSKSHILYYMMESKYPIKNTEKIENENKFNHLQDIENLHPNAIGELSWIHAKNLFYKYQSISRGHSAPYNELFFNFLYLHKSIDKSKIKIVDLDNPEYSIVDVIKKYFPEIKETDRLNNFWSHRSKHELVLKGIETHSKIELDGETIRKWLIKEVQRDYNYYKLLKESYTEYEL